MSTSGPSAAAPSRPPVKALIPLVPFPGLPAPEADLRVTLEVNSALETSARFHWRSRSLPIRIPALLDAVGSRQDRLWERTCFEVFLRIPGESSYWEINVAPQGNWNLYFFSGYREGMKAEAKVTEIHSSLCVPGSGETSCTLTLPLKALGLDPLKIEYSFTAVVDCEGAPTSYWAARHSGSQPDFHHPGSFSFRFP